MLLNIFFYDVLFLVVFLNCCQFVQCLVCCDTLDGECFDSKNPYLFQPNPECPTGDLEPVYNLFTRDNKEKSEEFKREYPPWSKLEKRSLYRFIVHGWGKSTGVELTRMKNAFLAKEDANVILVDASGLMNHPWYPSSAANTRTLGAHMAMLFKEIKGKHWLSGCHIWCIGHSLGAHSCGHAGQRKKIDRITGIDPASILFQGILDNKIGLSPDDASFVDVIHTSFLKGSYKRLGHADFYANGGRSQPACGHFDPSCDHRIGLKYLTNSLKYQCGGVWSCLNIWFFKFTCTESPGSRMGYDAKTWKHGAFWVKVTAEEPYCTT